MRSSGRNSNRNYRGAGNGRDAKRQQAGRPRPEERRYPTSGGAGRPDRPARDDRGGRDDRDDRRGSGGGPRDRDGRDRRDDREGRGRGDGRDGRDRRDDREGREGRDRRDGGDRRSGRQSSDGGSGRGIPGARAGGRRGGPPPSRRTPPARSREYQADAEERVRARHDRPARRLPKTFDEPEGERLQKVLARAGLGSRRACEELIDAARVEVNGRIVTTQGRRVDPERDEIKVDGLTVAAQKYLFFALNKPAGVVSAMHDPEGRQCLGDYVTNRETRLFHVGRLDTETEGLILLTNHGEVAHRLTHPRYGITKTYLAAIQGPIPRDLGKRLKDGVPLDDGFARADNFRVVENTGRNYLVEVSLHEGRKHIVRRMLAEAGFPVDRLVRTRFGPIPLGDQKSGWLRRMTNTEVGQVMQAVGL
ncbi:pseudouridine synthase [Streptomyces sp. B6B3]|uniref:pseudouridine synthase n=1 Tax=Streptomyces sp. B6B3 TaxID=3153570 RepID=UPI00325CCE80